MADNDDSGSVLGLGFLETSFASVDFYTQLVWHIQPHKWLVPSWFLLRTWWTDEPLFTASQSEAHGSVWTRQEMKELCTEP
jgi:hypothetical protein